MTILCHNTKMFPLIIAGVLQLWDGPLGCFSFCLQVECKQNFLRRLILNCWGFFLNILSGFWGYFFFYYSNRAASQITAIVRQEESFLEQHRTACKHTESPSFCCSALMLGHSIQPSPSPFQHPLCPPGSGHKSLGELPAAPAWVSQLPWDLTLLKFVTTCPAATTAFCVC